MFILRPIMGLFWAKRGHLNIAWLTAPWRYLRDSTNIVFRQYKDKHKLAPLILSRTYTNCGITSGKIT